MLIPAAITGKKGEIFVGLDNTSSNSLKQFKCNVCGKVVFEYYSELKIVMAGAETETIKAPIVVQCHGAITVYNNGFTKTTNCKTKYYISQSI